MPSVRMFSAKEPAERSGKTFCMLFMLSAASRLTCLCQSPACASPRIPQFCFTSTLSTGYLVVPRFSLMHSATTDAILLLLSACFRISILHVLSSCPYSLQTDMYLSPFTMHMHAFQSKNLHLQRIHFTPISLLGQSAFYNQYPGPDTTGMSSHEGFPDN